MLFQFLRSHSLSVCPRFTRLRTMLYLETDTERISKCHHVKIRLERKSTDKHNILAIIAYTVRCVVRRSLPPFLVVDQISHY